jgi:hypothetical protein
MIQNEATFIDLVVSAHYLSFHVGSVMYPHVMLMRMDDILHAISKCVNLVYYKKEVQAYVLNTKHSSRPLLSDIHEEVARARRILEYWQRLQPMHLIVY